jgi:hypothetical protein
MFVIVFTNLSKNEAEMQNFFRISYVTFKKLKIYVAALAEILPSEIRNHSKQGLPVMPIHRYTRA